MRVHAICGYPGKSEAWNGDWENVHFRARNLVKGVKREQFGGYSDWRAKNKNQVLRQYSNEQGNKLALAVAASKLVDLFDAAGIQTALVVPVPSSQTINPGADYTGIRLAREIEARRPGLVATPVLYFDSPQPSAHDGGGERRWHMILPHLRGTPIAAAGQVVLLDDVLTSGGHLRACRRFLDGKGRDPTDAFVIGRTVWERPADMFAVPPETLPY